MHRANADVNSKSNTKSNAKPTAKSSAKAKTTTATTAADAGAAAGSGAAGRDPADVEGRLQTSLAFMAREFRRGPRLGEIARAAHFSEYHFHRVFRKRFGKTPKQVLAEHQIAEAKRLMLAGHRPADAARAAGFSHQAHLTSRFRQMTGPTPRPWVLSAKAKAKPEPVSRKR
jgi:AraC-like DNA-binding protein